MNKAEIVLELINLRNDIAFEKSIPKRIKKAIHNRLSGIIIDLLDEDKPDCSSCPAMKKVDNLADAIDQAVLISKETRTPFKVACITRPYQGDINESD